MFKHDRVISTRPTVRVQDRQQMTVYVIFTDLQVDPLHKDYNAELLRDLEKAAQKFIDQHPEYDGFSLRHSSRIKPDA